MRSMADALHPTMQPMRAATLLSISSVALVALLASASVLAQPAQETVSSTTVPKNDRHNQRIERIRVEDQSARVDELRVGGETKSITVQPKDSNLPAYEVQPANPGRDGGLQGQDGTNGKRTWKALQF